MRHGLSIACLLVLNAGCGGGDDGSATSPSDTGRSPTDTGSMSPDTGGDASDTATATETGDGGPTLVNDCADGDFIDATADAMKRKIDNWSTPSDKICVKISKGQSFTWNPAASFMVHPLEPFGGDTPNPIPLTDTGTTKTVTFPNEGTFGYHCANHSLMRGAIRVVP